MPLLIASAIQTLVASPTGQRSNVPVPEPGPQWTVSGTVWVHSATGKAPARSGAVFGWIEHSRKGWTTGRVPIGTDGRFQFTIPAGTTRVRLQGPRHQPCAVTVEPAADVTADIHTVPESGPLGASLPDELMPRKPILSGVVYETTPTGRRPLPQAWVSLDPIQGLGLVIASTLTDADGRYVLCGVPYLPGLVLMVSRDGFESFQSPGDLTDRGSFDVEMRRSRE
jgi:hypothetical protein